MKAKVTSSRTSALARTRVALEGLSMHDRIDPDALADRFAQRYRRDPMRGYGGTAHETLNAIQGRNPGAD
jgi:hypothetical protein